MFKTECRIEWLNDDEFYVIYTVEQPVYESVVTSPALCWDNSPKSYTVPEKEKVKPKIKT